MARIALPAIPDSGREFEDYVAGLLQAAGYYVEKNVRQREVTDVLELDAVATSYDDPLPTSILTEVKGGRWGFPDLFKVAGWMQYLGIERGGFFVKGGTAGGERDLSPISRTMAPLRVALVDLGDFSNPSAALRMAGFAPLHDRPLLDVWRYSFWVERTLLENLRAARRATPSLAGPGEVLSYHDLINDHLFFVKTVSGRLSHLYGAYRAHPKLSSALATELGGGPFRADPNCANRRRSPVLAAAMYRGEHPALQASFYVEHRARLSILKAAIDLLCLARAGRVSPADDVTVAVASLPATFRAGLRRLQDRPTFRRYALLWQVFLWGFGGFYLADREDEEFAALSAQTGVPRAEIGPALDAFNDLFPLSEGGWMVPLKNTSLRIAKMVPAAFRGVGALQRLRRHHVRDFDGMSSGLTRQTLIGWHNCLVRVLADSEASAAAKKKAAPSDGPAAKARALRTELSRTPVGTTLHAAIDACPQA